ncbi:DUF695 domain-containing protein [Mucilaginibacter terrenus]|uniref:DUF695 domain-containing protein n=1 Tax=Mucilaginibacter terrenus TaxID=2482727 RepID=A0A3E2NXF8_9SPHI|nr:DUF695 domain-containing protein [Mucilaginibacter terrenus]RFZ85601.1 DUF695 domain-containing protein [Mucilaginibacter terrenus]
MAEQLTLDDTWAGASGTNDEGVAVIIRYRPSLRNFVDTGRYNIRMDMVWTYDEEESAYLPSPGEMQVMEDVENALIDALETDRQAVLAFIFTGAGERVWSWYSTGIKETGERLNLALANFEVLPLQITQTEDPEWDEYFSFVEEFEDAED